MSHDPSEIILICCFDAPETSPINNVENCYAAQYVLGDVIHLEQVRYKRNACLLLLSKDALK